MGQISAATSPQTGSLLSSIQQPAVTVHVEALLRDPAFRSAAEFSRAFIQPVTVGQDEALDPNLDVALTQAFVWRSGRRWMGIHEGIVN